VIDRFVLSSLTAAVVAAALSGTAPASAQAPASAAPPSRPPLAAPTGVAARGKTIFEQTLRCYACHGFDGQTGSPRLVPMNRSEDLFLAYVRKPATPGMPSFADAPERDLVDVYAYVRSIPLAAPPAESLPLLKRLLDRRSQSK
jgi:mono/diheme cytochrome c family protein